MHAPNYRRTFTGGRKLYMQGTSADEFPPDSEIPVEMVRRAVHEFAETYRRPSEIPWQPFRGGRVLPSEGSL